MNHFDHLYQKALKIAPNRELVVGYSSCGGVSSALIAGSGNIYTGVCIDFSCGLGFCAEHATIADMLKNGESEILEIIAVRENGAVVPPCGRCREMIIHTNLKNRNTLVHLSISEHKKLNDLLPNHWIPIDS